MPLSTHHTLYTTAPQFLQIPSKSNHITMDFLTFCYMLAFFSLIVPEDMRFCIQYIISIILSSQFLIHIFTAPNAISGPSELDALALESDTFKQNALAEISRLRDADSRKARRIEKLERDAEKYLDKLWDSEKRIENLRKLCAIPKPVHILKTVQTTQDSRRIANLEARNEALIMANTDLRNQLLEIQRFYNADIATIREQKMLELVEKFFPGIRGIINTQPQPVNPVWEPSTIPQQTALFSAEQVIAPIPIEIAAPVPEILDTPSQPQHTQSESNSPKHKHIGVNEYAQNTKATAKKIIITVKASARRDQNISISRNATFAELETQYRAKSKPTIRPEAVIKFMWGGKVLDTSVTGVTIEEYPEVKEQRSLTIDAVVLK
jgi:hypothetical protein